ncbi:hypothetical protein OG741_37615 [Streptomyces sp. NBC_01410]|uniref:hypothetical protein n=1 Tax=Streptomyces sp. NBC_01410 TaxID=2903856 RepID=UPI003254B37B
MTTNEPASAGSEPEPPPMGQGLPKPPSEPPHVPGAGGRRWWSNPLLAGLCGLVVGAGSVGGVWWLQASGGADKPGVFTLRGTLLLTTGATSATIDDSECAGGGGYDDIASGASVTVYNAAGDVVASGALGKGDQPDGSSLRACTFPVSVSDVPKGEKFYQVEVTHRGKISVSSAEAQAGGFTASLG